MGILEKEDRNLIKRFFYIALIAIVCVIIISYGVVKYSTQIVGDTYAGILGSLSEEYSGSEESIIQEMSKISEENKDIGYGIMDKYGLIMDEQIKSNNLTQPLLLYLLIILLAGVLLVFIALFYIISKHIKIKSRVIEEIIRYFAKLNEGDYYLDIRDNDEGIVSMLKNEIYKTTIMLREQQELLRKEKNNLSNSISDISHQLKTPITSLSIMNDLLYKDLPIEKKKEFLNRNQMQLERMQWLVTALLNIAKFDAGIVKFKMVNIDIHELIQETITHLKDYSADKNIGYHIAGDSKASFSGDYHWSLEGLLNIIKNCIDHSYNNGQINISYSENYIYSQISVQDFGTGINMEDVSHIFERFYKGKNAKESSVGIGLSLSKSIFQQENGEIRVESKLGTGTTFFIKLYKQIMY